jgi:hypothetical protein
VTPTAGEPKGFGEINVTIKIGGFQISPGDWIVADESGVVRIPRAKVVEVANRAQDVLEHENRLREEIRRKATLGSVAELHRWEKHIVDGLDKGNGKEKPTPLKPRRGNPPRPPLRSRNQKVDEKSPKGR